MEVIAPLISIERQMKNLVSCMTSLLSASTLPVRVCKRGWGGHLYILDMYKHVYNIYNYMIYTIYSLYFFVRAVTQANKKKEFMHLILYFAMLTTCKYAYRRCLNRLVALTLKVRLTNDWWGKFLSDFYAYYINRL